MAATKKLKCHLSKNNKRDSAVLKTLITAALTLPGIAPPVPAAEKEFSLQHSHYQEGKRQLIDSNSLLNPIEVDSLQGSAKFKLAERLKFAFNYTQDTWSGATPITTAPVTRNGNALRVPDDLTSGASAFIQPTAGVFDKNFNPLKLDPFTGEVANKDSRLVHTLAAASPETRKQGDFKLGYEWDNAALDIGGGLSVERDYESRFGSVNGRWDFNQKLTSVNLGLSYTNSETHALMDHAARDYFGFSGGNGGREFPLSDQSQTNDHKTYINGNRQDWSANIGLNQILNKNALVNLNLGYTRSTGFMENPYKAVTFMFVDPTRIRSDGNLNGTYLALHEQRPNERNQWTENLSYIHHIDALDAALHFDYRFFHDDWGINAHTFELEWGQPLGQGWTITPRVRYYSQSAADFYQPVFLSKQGAPGSVILGPDGLPLFDNKGNIQRYKAVDSRTLPTNYSSDHRLSGYGALSGGITLSKQFAKGLNLQMGFEYYTHAGSLKLGGGGEAAYADFNYYVANAALNVDLATLASAGSSSMPHDHAHHHAGHTHTAPAGIMFDHSLDKAGDIMMGYRYMYGYQAGSVLQGDTPVTDSTISRFGGCSSPDDTICRSVPGGMAMHMHMVELMYAPTDWLTLMLMPQFVDMNMNVRELDGVPPAPGAAAHLHEHSTGGVGDTGLYVMTKLFDQPGHHVTLSLGVTAPTGDVGIRLRDTHGQGNQFIHYGMQLGSGTWDFKPSLTYTGELNKWSWGVQATGTQRLESKNTSGFAFGDMFQASAWGGYNLTDWLSASIRGVYTVQGRIKNQFNDAQATDGPQDFPSNYGGRYWDLGLGLSAMVPSGDLQGNRISFEWLQPIHDDVNGYQVERDAALSATWSYMF